MLLPHRGYVTDAGFAAFYRNAIEVVEGMVTGRPVRVLNPDVLDSLHLRAGAPARSRDARRLDGRPVITRPAVERQMRSSRRPRLRSVSNGRL